MDDGWMSASHSYVAIFDLYIYIYIETIIITINDVRKYASTYPRPSLQSHPHPSSSPFHPRHHLRPHRHHSLSPSPSPSPPGSIATGKRINEAAANDMKRITLECGGNDAVITLSLCMIQKKSHSVGATVVF